MIKIIFFTNTKCGQSSVLYTKQVKDACLISRQRNTCILNPVSTGPTYIRSARRCPSTLQCWTISWCWMCSVTSFLARISAHQWFELSFCWPDDIFKKSYGTLRVKHNTVPISFVPLLIGIVVGEFLGVPKARQLGYLWLKNTAMIWRVSSITNPVLFPILHGSFSVLNMEAYLRFWLHVL